MEYTRNAIADISKGKVAEQGSPVPQQQTPSLADELLKLAKLKEQGVLSEAEFTQMKQDIIKKMT